MRILGNNSDLLESFEVVVDQDAQPADWDDALAGFLLALVGRKLATSSEASTENGAARTQADQRKSNEAVAQKPDCR